MNSVNEIRSAIITSGLSNDDLNDIAQAITYARSQLRTQVKRSLTVGNTVKFKDRHGVYSVGTLTKVAIKFATVKTNQGAWRVPLNMLEAA
jgi:hypothetical protein